MGLKIKLLKRVLQFKFNALTSRGSLASHSVYYLLLHDEANGEVVGVGEAAPLQGLSREYGPEFEEQLERVVKEFNGLDLADGTSFDPLSVPLPELRELPSVRFAFETAFADFANGGTRRLFRNSFSCSEEGIPINGLVWMGAPAFMRKQIREKLEQGYDCLKLKIGSLNFSEELELLREIRQLAGPESLTLRLDANGAFSPAEALPRLIELARFQVHSLEQPIKAGQIEEMARVCSHSSIPIALDEELIGVEEGRHRQELVQEIKPAYLILKPTLLGGFSACREWISLAEQEMVGWWMTSALESNIGLNAISQFTAEFINPLPQGLGTGQLYHNNIASPLYITSGRLYYERGGSWEKFW